MNNKICTSIEQSKKLLSLGLDPSSADMWYQHTGFSIKDGSEKLIYFPMIIRDCESDEDIPCWSIVALLELMPMVKMCHYDLYYCQYIKEYEDFPIHSTAEYNNPLDAAFVMVCWLIEQGHIKVNK